MTPGTDTPVTAWQKWQRNAPWVCSVTSAIASVLLIAFRVEVSLVVATAGLAVTIGAFWLAAFGWEKLADADEADHRSTATNSGSRTVPPAGTEVPVGLPTSRTLPRRELSPAMTAGTSLAITVQGVVLGLVFAFLDKNTASATVKVGVVSLGIGVIAGLLLYSLAAISVPGPRTRALTVLLFNVTLWGLCYGLLCIVAAVVAYSPSGRAT
jgi:hypothetical protein